MTARGMQVDYQPFPKLTKEFVSERIQVGWKDLAWAASNHWLDAKAVAGLADEITTGVSDDERVQLGIAAAEGDHGALVTLLGQLAKREAIGDEMIRERWMRIGVAWVYQHRQLFNDPWAVIEEIWEAFGHPVELNGLIRWMPLSPGCKPGEQEMLNRWRELARPR
jgi:hypothetical protein